MTGGLLLRWWWHDASRRPLRLLVVAAFVALGVGTLAAAFDGARRSATAVDRAVEVVQPADGIVVPNEPGFDWGPVAALPMVEDLVTFPVLYFEIEGWEGTWGGFPPAMPDTGRRWERPVVVAGRAADQTRADEVTVSPAVRDRGVDVGDRLTIRLFSMSEAFGGSLDPTRRDVEVTVVGVTKLGFFSADVQPTHAFHVAHEDLIVGEYGYINAIVRLRPGAELADLERAVTTVAGRPVEVLPFAEFIDGSREAVGVETAGLVALAVAGLVALLVLVGQAMVRAVGASAGELELLRLLGLTRRSAEIAVLAAPASALAAGALLAPFVAWFASGWFPIGVGAQMEPSPGRRIDWVVVPVAVLVPALALFGAMLVTARLVTRTTAAPVQRRDEIGDLVRRLPVGVPAMLGIRLALARQPGGGSARAVTWTIATGVVGVVAAVTFAAALRDAIDDPEVFGQGYDAGFALHGPAPDPADLAVLEPERLTRLVNVVASIDGRPVSVVGAADLVGAFEPTVTRGRIPSGAVEVGMSPGTMEELGVALGDVVELEGVDVTVVGEVLTPEVGHTSYTSGAVVDWPTIDRLLADGAEVKFDLLAVDLPDGTGLTEARRLLDDELAFAIEPWILPQRQRDLAGTRQLPLVFAGFVAALMVGSVAHALASTERRRRHEVAVLQVLGLRRSQVRRTVLWHATVATVTGCAIGVPVGLLLGRSLWRAVATSLPALHRTPGAWPAAVVVATTLFAGLVLARWSARRTARSEPALVLRTE